MNISAARRLAAVDERLVRIEQLLKLLRTEVTNVAEAVRVAAQQLRRGGRAPSGRGRKTAISS